MGPEGDGGGAAETRERGEFGVRCAMRHMQAPCYPVLLYLQHALLMFCLCSI